MKVLTENKNQLEKRYPEIWKKLQNKDKMDSDAEIIDKIEFIDTKENEKALMIYKKGICVRLNSQYYPIREAHQWSKQFEYNNISVNGILFGLGNGIFARELLSNLEKDSYLVIIEPDYQIFSRVIEVSDISDILKDDRVLLFFLCDTKEEITTKLSNLLTWGNLSTTIQTIHPGYSKIYLEQVKQYENLLNRIREKIQVDCNTDIYFSQSVVYNVIKNLQYIKESNYIGEFIDLFPNDYPAVIVSAGPSLEKNMHLLHKMKNKAFILVVDTAVKVMEQNGIPYDAIVLIDPQKPTDFIASYPGCKEKPLFCSSDSQTTILDFHTGRKIWSPGCLWLEQTYKKNGLLFPKYSVGGSVATMATEIARCIGIKTIILVGQDLAYLGDKTHAGRDEAMGEERGYPSKWVEGVDGNLVRTRWDWMYYLKWFEEFIENNPEVTLVDSTEGGALIHGSKVLPLAKSIEEYCNVPFSFDEHLNELPRTFEINDFTKIKKCVLDLKPDVEKAIKAAKKGVTILNRFYEKNNEGMLKELDLILKECMKLNTEIVSETCIVLFEIGISKAINGKLDGINKLTGDDTEDKKNTAKMLDAYYHAVIEVGENMLEEIEPILEKIE